MKTSGSLRYGLWSGSVALAAGAVLLALGPDGAARGWNLLGWLVMSAIGVAGGVVMAAVHGKPGPTFLAALVGSMLARLIAAALGAWAASFIGCKAAWPYVLGLGAGYVPLQLFEVVWFRAQTVERTR